MFLLVMMIMILIIVMMENIDGTISNDDNDNRDK